MCDPDNLVSSNKLSKSDAVAQLNDLLLPDSDSEEEPTSVSFDPKVTCLSSSEDDDDDESDHDDHSKVQDSKAPEGSLLDHAFKQSAAPKKQQSPFSLKGGSSGFSSRSRSIFDCLDSAAKLTSSQLGQDNVIDGVFVRPLHPPPLTNSKKDAKCTDQPPLWRDGGGTGEVEGKRGVPDYLLHPERWTCYSLENVPETSDRQNRMVAQQYLHSLQQRTEQKIGQQEDFTPEFNQGQNTSGCNSSHNKIIFSKPSRTAKEQADTMINITGGRVKVEDMGKEGMRATAKVMDHIKEPAIEKERERGKGMSHLDQEEDEEEEISAGNRPSLNEERNRKRALLEGGSDEQDARRKEAKPGFVSFRKLKHKNYRKTSKQDED
ncbi:protein TSSC4 [Lampris incognitus]|uniref:protein TSSC4 n=1 Tax=Lampris incognitus TaxID=2546036 RepID=UPI0024B60BF8|nr:protein TSSC4 [Lampris incognitus]XP_056135049.1 protein TSSC4 [Lampris incognitus]XP_056135050.1 protein TSSC4 [Lampris incognitus]XP_056135051.1 protein TSSC4 [Lampris incognitus]XP_056135052.1 protein TSSC4 [Lampris incognitus]XP_056135053.1 protein TSSC4 [Lampris incognitus]